MRTEPAVLVVGGTGSVGRVAAELAAAGALVTAASRHAPAAALGVEHVRLQAGDPVAVRRLLRERPFDVAVVCVEPAGVVLHRALLDAGVAVVDLTASPRRIRAIERLDARARERGVPVVVSVGIAPGLTNVLAAGLAAESGPFDRIDLTVLLGTDDDHGGESVRWLVDAVRHPVRSGLRPAGVTIDGRDRVAFPVAYSDQVALSRSLGIPVNTRMLFDSRVATALVFRRPFSWFGLRALTGLRTRAIVERLGRRLGGDPVLVLASGRRGTASRTVSVRARGQARTTGLVAATVALGVAAGEAQAGVHHIHEVDGVLARVARLDGRGLEFDPPRSVSSATGSPGPPSRSA